MNEQQLAAMRQALKRAFRLGQDYWSWADSEYSSHWKKADNAKAEFDKLVEDTTQPAQPAPVQEPVAWRWMPAPVKTQWGHEMVVADIALDKDNTVSVYCERNQTVKVEAMFNSPAAQRQWVGLTDEEIISMSRYDLGYAALIGEVQRKLKEKNSG